MTPLEQLVAQIPDISDAAAVRATLVAKTIRTVPFHGVQTIGRFTEAYGAAASSALLLTVKKAVAAIRTAGAGSDASEAQALFIENYAQKYVISGLELDKDNTQVELDALIPVIGADFVGQIKALGVVMQSRCDQASVSEPTLEEVQSAIAAVQTRRDAGAYWSGVLAVVNPMLDAGDSAESIKTAAMGVV